MLAMPSPLFVAVNHSLVGRLACGMVVFAALMGLEIAVHHALDSQARATWPVMDGSQSKARLLAVGKDYIPMPVNTPAAHASTLLAMPATHPAALMAFWFAGTRESASDVQIAASRFDRATQQWSSARFLVNRQVLGAQLGFGVRRLGNPVAWLDGARADSFVCCVNWVGWLGCCTYCAFATKQCRSGLFYANF
jgi:hypothetical protein